MTIEADVETQNLFEKPDFAMINGDIGVNIASADEDDEVFLN